MIVFNGDKSLAAQFVSRAEQLGTRLRRGEERKTLYFSAKPWCQACYVCQRGDCNHDFYAGEIGVPVSLAYAERAVFENLSNECAIDWPLRFVKAMPVGLDGALLEEATRQFVLYVLRDKVVGLMRYAVTPAHFQALAAVTQLFENNSKNAEDWKAARVLARRASRTPGVDTNKRLESKEAFIAAGDNACLAASYLAAAFDDPRYIADAIGWAAWSARYQRYAELMSGVARAGSDVQADRNGNVNVGLALFSFSRWMERSDRCTSVADDLRVETYEVYGTELLRQVKKVASHNGFGLMGKVHSLLSAGRSAATSGMAVFGYGSAVPRARLRILLGRKITPGGMMAQTISTTVKVLRETPDEYVVQYPRFFAWRHRQHCQSNIVRKDDSMRDLQFPIAHQNDVLAKQLARA